MEGCVLAERIEEYLEAVSIKISICFNYYR